MFLGITERLREKNQLVIKKKSGTVTTVFVILLLLPFIIYALFGFKIIPNKSPIGAEIQAPVAKVSTSSGSGSAFLITPTLLLTARHVVEDLKVGDEVDLSFERSPSRLETKAKIKFISPSTVQMTDNTVPMEYFLTDVAILEVSPINDIQPLALGESDVVNNLDEVVVVGYPEGDYAITKGSINSDKYQGLNLFKLDAASNPGNSGGPLILKGDNSVIGILVGGSAKHAQGENIALKINDVKAILRNAKINF